MFDGFFFAIFGFAFLVVLIGTAVTFALVFRAGRTVHSAIEEGLREERERRAHERRMAERQRPWHCGHCDSANEATAEECDHCGAPRPASEPTA